MKNKAIFWFRRDLRLSDNKALTLVTKDYKEVVPVFIFDENILSKIKLKKDKRVQIIFSALLELKEKLIKQGSDLLILSGDPVEIIPNLALKLKVEGVYANEDYEQYAIRRDKEVKKKLKLKSIDFTSCKDHVIFSGLEVAKKDNTAYRVFTPYKRQWLRQVTLLDLKSYKANLSNLAPKSEIPKSKVSTLSDIGFERTETFILGENQARKKFTKFLKKIDHYKLKRDMIAEDGTSSMSVYLRFGMISTREVVRKTIDLQSEGAQTWVSEIIWRDFYHMILNEFPYVEKGAFKEKYNDIKWPGSSAHFKKWKEGNTGFPLIDAAMKHFSKTGEMHNRLRMIVASFLVKDLLVDWKKGEKYFAEKLLDYDMAANNGGWQWCASTGCDAQPYFRIFNPITQSQRFDPEGVFIKEHLPELKNFNAKEVHFPQKCSIQRQKEVGCIVGKNYPSPIVEHSLQRILAIELFS